jgi:putative ATPase
LTLFDDFSSDISKKVISSIPLADRMRPTDLDGFVGQEHLIGKGNVLQKIIESDRLHSIIFWGPPGSGKTTLARIIANRTKSRFISFSAVSSGIKQVKEIMKIAGHELKTRGIRTILFIDEIHRFNKAQQDAFLPYVENGTIILIGATTENPSFEVNSALLSRAKTYILEKLSDADINILLKRALSDRDKGLGKYNISIDDKALDFISRVSDGDSRMAYNILELSLDASLQKNVKSKNGKDKHPDTGKKTTGKKDETVSIDQKVVENVTQRKALLYDKHGEEHFNLISALHKSLRGSDPDGAVYWTVRMLEGGEDPLYILRRMVRFASEDVGLADPRALQITLAAKQSFEFIGPPEGYLAIIEAVIYLALSPKSNSLYTTYKKVIGDIKRFLSLPVPHHIRNAPTGLMKEAGYGKGYKYDHDFKGAVASQTYLPEKLAGTRYYSPSGRGFEKDLQNRINRISQIRRRTGK